MMGPGLVTSRRTTSRLFRSQLGRSSTRILRIHFSLQFGVVYIERLAQQYLSARNILTKTTGITQSPRSVWSTTPFRSLRSVARVATTGRRCSSPSFLGFGTSKPTSTIHLFHVALAIFISLARCGLEILRIVYPLFGQSLLLSLYQVSDTCHGIENSLLMAHNVITLYQGWQRTWHRTGSLGLVSSCPIIVGEVQGPTTAFSDLSRSVSHPR